MAPELRLDVFAKLTLCLRVLRVRPDGFHEIEALTTSIDAPADALTIIERHDDIVRCHVSGRQSLGVPDDDRNLAVQAVRAVLAAAGDGVTRGAELLLHKRIASGAGLGGGSADAAAALRGTRDLFGLTVDDATLAALAPDLGSDVPFCLTGGLAWMRGRGEIIEPVAADPTRACAIVVAVPPFTCDTPEVYRAWDALGGPTSDRRVEPPPALAHVVTELRNDLEPAAITVQPGLVEFRAAVEAEAHRPAMLAGSGAAYALTVKDIDHANDIVDRLDAKGIEAHAANLVHTGFAPAAQ
jgi:4-diphosphocytidyl-2-C-methyl-D-erythritol kinase